MVYAISFELDKIIIQLSANQTRLTKALVKGLHESELDIHKC